MVMSDLALLSRSSARSSQSSRPAATAVMRCSLLFGVIAAGWTRVDDGGEDSDCSRLNDACAVLMQSLRWWRQAVGRRNERPVVADSVRRKEARKLSFASNGSHFQRPLWSSIGNRGSRPTPAGATRSRLWKLFPLQWREPSVSPDESRGLNKVRLRQRNEPPGGAGH